jgi:hypothetical protein
MVDFAQKLIPSGLLLVLVWKQILNIDTSPNLVWELFFSPSYEASIGIRLAWPWLIPASYIGFLLRVLIPGTRVYTRPTLFKCNIQKKKIDKLRNEKFNRKEVKINSERKKIKNLIQFFLIKF